MAAAQAGALTGVRVEAAVVDIFTSIKPSPLLPRPREKETVWKVQRQGRRKPGSLGLYLCLEYRRPVRESGGSRTACRCCRTLVPWPMRATDNLACPAQPGPLLAELLTSAHWSRD